ncbi:MAG: hypothetical protein KAH99_06420 [Verrucomicrobia bacterium]|nr:hypothetical protein [Verrucomicrobiota bacterium]
MDDAMGVRCFDMQVNGWGGVDFSSSGLTREGIARAADMLEQAGTEKFLPTMVTSSPETYQVALPLLGAACEEDSRMPGIHLEGPFISCVDGAVGAHPKVHAKGRSRNLVIGSYPS